MNELYRLVDSLLPFNTGTSEAHEEFRADRVLTYKELLCLIYHDLKSWNKVKPNSDSYKLAHTLFEQLEQAYPSISITTPPKGVEIGWMLQEHICAETEDYTFGVYEPPTRIRILVQSGQPILPCLEDEATISESKKEALLAMCPHFDLTDPYFDIEQCLLSFFEYYALAPTGTFNLDTKLIDDVEHFITGDMGEGRIFTTSEGEDGISDHGVVIATLIMFDFSTLTGVRVVEDDEKYTFECLDDEVGNYYECVTIGDMANILNDVKFIVRRENENSN